MLLLAWLLAALAAPELKGSAGLTLGWVRYDDLWAGDPLLGGFSGSSTSHIADDFLLAPWAEGELRLGTRHRFRLRANLRTLQLGAYYDADGERHVTVSSDGVLLRKAWKERLFLDEASWRFRPMGDPFVDLRLGILPFDIAEGRLFSESWPGLRFRVDLSRRTAVPLAIETRLAVTTAGDLQTALEIRHEPSIFEHDSLEVAFVWDRKDGLAPLATADFGTSASVFYATTLSAMEPGVLAAFLQCLRDSYPPGSQPMHEDMLRYMDLGGTQRSVYADVSSQHMVGPISLSAMVVGTFSTGVVTGKKYDRDGDLQPNCANWVGTLPTKSFTFPVQVTAGALDLELATLTSPVGGRLFFQAMTGDGNWLATAANGDTVHAFVASDQNFARTRLFPVDAARHGGGTTLPAGVAGYGLLAPGAAITVAAGPFAADLQTTLPMSWSAICTGCTSPSGERQHDRRLYGFEGDLTVSARFFDVVTPQAEAGIFVPGSFFVFDGSEDRGSTADMPVGWRVFVGIEVRTPEGAYPPRRERVRDSNGRASSGP